jgi:hypothetical protein
MAVVLFQRLNKQEQKYYLYLPKGKLTYGDS